MTDATEHPTPEAIAFRGLGLSAPLLLDRHRINEDLRLAARAVRNRWNLPPTKCDNLVSRLFDITAKTEVTVITKNGEELSVGGPADVNAIAAARVLVVMMGQNQTDEIGVAGTTVNVGVNLTQYEERVAGRPYAEVRAALAAEAAEMTRFLEAQDAERGR